LTAVGAIGTAAGVIAFVGCAFLSAYCAWLYWHSDRLPKKKTKPKEKP
jgi:hypothetical protein